MLKIAVLAEKKHAALAAFHIHGLVLDPGFELRPDRKEVRAKRGRGALYLLHRRENLTD